jgi:CelD/BcsL family acetyltransferase involved in cellulose biosynthesis
VFAKLASEVDLRLVVHKSIPEDQQLRKQWNALLTLLDRPQVFYTYEWALAVQRAYQASLQTLLFLAYDVQESLCGVAALASKPDDNKISFLCATTGDYCDFLCRPAHKKEFFASVLTELRKLGTRNLTLTNLPADSDTLPALREAGKENGYHCFARTAYVCSQVSLEKVERRKIDNKLVLPRKKMRRFLNAIGRESPVFLDHAQSWHQIRPLLPAFIQAHVARFLLTGRISNLVRRERQIFLEELARLLAESGWIALTRLGAGEKVYAWNYGFRFQGTWFWYQPTFDSAIEKYSPGYCLLAKLIEEAAENPTLKTVDLGLGHEEYKDRFANQSRKTLFVTLRASATEHASEIINYWAVRTVKAAPLLEKGVRAGAARLKRIYHPMDHDGFTLAETRVPKRLRESFWSEDEVFFYEWCGRATPVENANHPQPLDANHLATAAMQNENDRETLTYLLRCASRLQERNAEGFALVDPEGRFLHFGWVAPFDGFFLSELKAKLDAPSPNSFMLFDCWTPLALRGHGYYAKTVRLIAERLQKEGKAPWICSKARNSSSMRGLEKWGFQRRYSLIRQRRLLWQRIKGTTPRCVEEPAAEASAHVRAS